MGWRILFCRRGFFRALPEFLRGWAESAFCRDDADRKWRRFRSEVQKLYLASETAVSQRFAIGYETMRERVR